MKNKRTKRVISIMLCMVLALSFIGTLCVSTVAQAANVNSLDALANLESAIVDGVARSGRAGIINADDFEDSKYAVDYSTRTYDIEDGGYLIYPEITTGDSQDACIDLNAIDSLTQGGKRQFLSDVISICNNITAWNEMQKRDDESQEGAISTETVSLYTSKLQRIAGAGSQLIASLMSETKPDYAAANKIYQPFSGVVGTILGILCILIMALLGITMGLDIAFITIPAFQLALDGGGEGGGEGKGKSGIARIISQEARSAVSAAENTGGTGQNGSGNKLAISVYFKHRWKGLVVLGICLLYLVQGQIYSFVAWILDLVSGFVGF